MQRDRWRASLLAREALLNCFAPRARLYPLILIAALLGVAGPLLAAWQSTQLQHQLAVEAIQGRNLVTIAALDKNDPATITTASCDRLTTDPDVLAAGTVRPVETAGFLQLGTAIPVLEASPTLLPQLQAQDALVGPGLTARRSPFRLLLPTGETVTAARGEQQPDALGTDVAVTLALPPTVHTTATCLVKLAPTAQPQQVGQRLVTEVDASGGPLSATTSFTEPQNPITVFAGRADRYVPVALGVLGGILSAVVARRRAGEWAAYRMSGTGPRSMAMIIALESAAQAGVMLLSSVIAAAALYSKIIGPFSDVALAVAGASAWVAVSVAATADLSFRRPTDLAKDH
jgi:hypothetical protein